MWLFTLIFLVLCSCSWQDDCSRSISMSHNGYVNLVLGQRFNLTCSFSCFTVEHKGQLLKDELLLSELSLSSVCPESKHTIVLLLSLPAVQFNDSGRYRCRSDQRDSSSSVTIKVVATDEKTDKERNITGTSESELTSAEKSTCLAPVSWNAPLYYFLCKTALFLLCSLGVLWMKSCSDH